MDTKKVLSEVTKEIEQSSSQQELQNIKVAYLGKKGKITERIPMGRMGTADDISSLVKFLLSNEAGYITGQNIHVNGGLFLG